MTNFETSFKSASIPAAGTYNVVFTTGDLGATFTSRIIGFSGSAGAATVYEGPTGVTGGSTAAIHKLNQRFTTAPLGVMTHGVTISGTGTQASAPTYYRGTTNPGPGVVGTYATAAASRTLKPNTTYLLQFVNNDAAAQVLDIYFAWQE